MSVEGARQLLERARSDGEFQRKLVALPSTEERKAFIHECGYDVDPGDLALLREAAGLGELSEEDLDRVAAAGSNSSVLGEMAAVIGGGGLLIAVGAALAL